MRNMEDTTPETTKTTEGTCPRPTVREPTRAVASVPEGTDGGRPSEMHRDVPVGPEAVEEPHSDRTGIPAEPLPLGKDAAATVVADSAMSLSILAPDTEVPAERVLPIPTPASPVLGAGPKIG